MKKIRIGKDIRIRWRILTNGETHPLDGRDLRLEVVSGYGRTQMDFSIEEGNVVVFILSGVKQKHLGRYRFTLWENCGQSGQTVVDSCDGVELVPVTCMEGDDGNGLDTETVDLETSSLELGVSGDSAYEIWLSQGHEGTEEDFLEWLRQPSVESAGLAETAAGLANAAASAASSAAAGAAATDAAVQKAEASRVQAESRRTSAEQARVKAEQDRETEFTRLKEESETATAAANTAAAAANEAAQGIDTKIALKQDVTDPSLETTDKTVTGAINEVLSGLSALRETVGDIDTVLDNINGEEA